MEEMENLVEVRMIKNGYIVKGDTFFGPKEIFVEYGTTLDDSVTGVLDTVRKFLRDEVAKRS